MLETLSDVLTRMGYEVTAVSDSLKAVELTRQQEFDIVITDIRMPGIDGLEALERMRQAQPDVRSMVVTGYSTEADSIRAIRLGVGDYLKKPFRLEQFREAVGRLAEKIQEDQRKIEAERDQCHTLIWALEAVARNAQLSEGLDWLRSVGGLAYRLSLARDLPNRAAELMQLGCLWWSVEQNLAGRLPAFIRRSLPESVQPMLLHLEENLESQDTAIVRAAQLLAQGQSLDELNESWRGLMQLAAESAQGSSTALSPGEQPASQRRSLLSLGLALEDALDHEGAEMAYKDLVAQPASRESTAAALGLSRLARHRGDKAAVRESALMALALARSLGPLCLASSGVQAGTLLAGAGASEAIPVLEESAASLQKLGFLGGEAQARTALSWLQGRQSNETQLSQMLQHSLSGELSESAWWLLPIVLEGYARQPSPVLEQAAHRLLTEKPSACARLLAMSTLSVPARVALARLNPSAELMQRLANDADESVRQAASAALGKDDGPLLPTLRIFTLGSLDVFHGDERVDESAWKKNQKAVYLLACVVAQEGRPISEEVLAEAFWPDDEAKGRANLYSLRSILRKALRPKSVKGDLDYLVKVQAGIRLAPDLPHWSDYQELLDCLKRAQLLAVSGQVEAEKSQLRRALQLYRGPFLESCYLDWALGIRQRLERMMLDAVLRLATLAFQAGAMAEARETCAQALEIDELNEEAYSLAMQSLISQNKAVEAMRLYERCEALLKKHLQAEPAISLVELYHRARLLT